MYDVLFKKRKNNPEKVKKNFPGKRKGNFLGGLKRKKSQIKGELITIKGGEAKPPVMR